MFTYVVKTDSTVEARILQVGEETNSLTVVTGGLKDGEEVVLNNQYRLQPGARVRSVGPSPSETAKSGAARAKESS
jgi:multidrug efflux pump subunit AcrA (membrane-fusion protein)